MSALDKPVLVPMGMFTVGSDGRLHGPELFDDTAEARVRPSDVLAALDAEQREHLSRKITPLLCSDGCAVCPIAWNVVQAMCAEETQS